MISHRETFRQIVGNIFKVFNLFEEEMKGRVESGLLLTEENASVLDTFLGDMVRFAKEFSTYKLASDDGSASGTSGVWFTMCSSIPSTLFTDKSLNVPHNTHNTKELLESGKCIIVSINNEEVMGTLFNYYAEYFSARASRPDIRPVTIMLEEANRLLTTMINIDLEKTITYSRQAKLSIVTVFQSWGQAYEVFGRYVAESIFENVTRLTMVEGGKKDAKYLYYSMDDDSIHAFDPKFATDKELYVAELEYQKITRQFSSIEKSVSEVVVFDHFLYEYSNEVTLVDVETLSSRSVKYMPMEKKNKNGYFVTKLKNRMRESSSENELSF